VTYTIDPTQLMLLDEGAPITLRVRASVGPGHRLRVECRGQVRMVRVLEVRGVGRVRVEVDE
jgi:hypothetical protein